MKILPPPPVLSPGGENIFPLNIQMLTISIDKHVIKSLRQDKDKILHPAVWTHHPHEDNTEEGTDYSPLLDVLSSSDDQLLSDNNTISQRNNKFSKVHIISPSISFKLPLQYIIYLNNGTLTNVHGNN